MWAGYAGSMRTATAHRLATVGDLLAIPEEQRFHEIVGGDLVQKAMPAPKHGQAQRKLSALVDPYGRRRPRGPDDPWGWWFLTEQEVWFEINEVYRPDVSGWRRERLPVLPETTPIYVRPDWVCEILSPSNHRTDRVDKFDCYERCGVPHYWIVDPLKETLKAYRWAPKGYLLVLTAEKHEKVKVEPFDLIDIPVAAFFGDEEDGE